MKLILASNNKNKLREFREILEPMGFDVISQSEAGANIEVEETGTTFEENAYLKAKAIYDMFHLPVISDDSGLEVDALNGAPGIYSARYAEEGKRCARVLSELENVPDDKRTARFRCCICYIDENRYSDMKQRLSDTDIKVLCGMDGLCEVSSLKTDAVVNSVVGMVGLRPTLAALDAGNKVALANKETLVTGGELVMKKAKEKNNLCSIQ